MAGRGFTHVAVLLAILCSGTTGPAVRGQTGGERQEERGTTVFLVDGQPAGPETPVMLAHAGKTITRLLADPGRAPVWYPVCTPGGVRVTRGYPLDPQPGEPHDHPHHRSLWFGHGDVNGLDFWSGNEVVQTWFVASSNVDGSLTAEIQGALLDRDGTVLAKTRTEWRWRIEGGATVCDGAVTLSGAGKSVRLGDTKEGFFALRLRQEFVLPGAEESSPHQATALNSSGDRDLAVWGRRARWVCYQAAVDGSAVSVAMLDHPANLRHPGTWHARNYGLFAANPFGLHDFLGRPAGEGDYLIEAEESLTLRYRIIVADGLLEGSELDGQWERWAQSPQDAAGGGEESGH